MSLRTRLVRQAAGSSRAASRSLHQDGRPIAHDATPSYTTSPPVPPSSSSSGSAGAPPDAAMEDAGGLPYAAPSSSGNTPASGRGASTARSPSGRPLLVKEFTPKGRPVFTRPPVPLSVRQQIQSTLPASSPFVPAPKDPGDTEALAREMDARASVHPLWAFFHVPADARPLGAQVDAEGRVSGETGDGAGMGSLDTLDSTDGRSEIMTSGRSWTAAELRQKSFADLHTLWYLLLRERNVLATQREERRRLGIVSESEIITKRAFRCRKTMARIKYVLNERRLGLVAAVEGARADAGEELPRIPGRSPLGAVDPLSLTGREAGVRDVLARPDVLAPPRRARRRSASSAASAEATDAPAPERPVVPSSDPSVQGDGERQKSLPATPASNAPLADVDSPSAVVPDEGVARSEVEGRDEGFGGGREGEEVVKDLERRGL